MRSLCFISLVLFGFPAFSQSEEIDFERIINTNSFLSEEVLNAEEEINSLLIDVLSSPIELNSVSEELLRGIAFLSDYQVRTFLEFREKSGPFLSVWELQLIEGWDTETCHKIADISTITKPGNKIFLKDLGKNTVFLLRQSYQFQPKRGFSDSLNQFTGDRQKLQMRIKSSEPGNYILALAMENDAGEKFSLQSGQSGFDHVSGNISLLNKGLFKKIILGDFRVQSGQGLITGSAFGGRKSSEPIMSLRKPNTGLIPASSFGESGFMRGLATTIEFKRFRFTNYISYKKRDATIRFESPDSIKYFTSINESGLHRTYKEKTIDNSISETTGGFILSLKKSQFEMGIQSLVGLYSIPVGGNNEPYQNFKFKGKNFHNEGLFLNYGRENFNFFVESAVSGYRDFGSLAGIILALSRKIDLSFLARHYSPGYFAPHSKAFGEFYEPANETGLFWGIKYQPGSRISVAGYFDYFRFPWLKFGIDSPSDGFEWLLRIDYLSKRTPFYVIFRRERKYSGPGSDFTFTNLFSERNNLTMNFQFELLEHFSGSIRPVFTFTGGGEQEATGILFRQDFKLERKFFSLNFGYFLFDTSSFDARLYAPEPEVRFQSSFPMFNGEGMRYFILLRIKARKSLNFYIKYHLTSYNSVTKIGSGPDQIEGNRISEIKTQLIYSFK